MFSSQFSPVSVFVATARTVSAPPHNPHLLVVDAQKVADIVDHVFMAICRDFHEPDGSPPGLEYDCFLDDFWGYLLLELLPSQK